MTRWRPLPEALPREARHLVEQLRSLKDRTGLSLAELARRTAYSKSSWQRYLSGAKQPPRGAVQALCRVAGAEQARLLALWDLADPTWPHCVAGAPPPGAPPPGASPLGASPLGASPLGASPLGASPPGASPLGAFPPGVPPHGVAGAAGSAGVPAAGAPGAGLAHRRWRAAALVSFAVIVVLLAGLLWVLPLGRG
ncbi:helix-turn-helix domain-containing protein [Streptomyces sp. XY006]|uniref:helix-turn-helix domain-containing protein n=1 Tax=Streptomyces sp. XY006 TaxID=2021410 RepID=UPI0026C38907